MKTLKENENEYTWGNVTVKLAESYGFCWGVERAVQIAYEARKQFPEENIWITHEIFHNPSVNKVYIFLPKFYSNFMVILSQYVCGNNMVSFGPDGSFGFFFPCGSTGCLGSSTSPLVVVVLNIRFFFFFCTLFVSTHCTSW